ncbi:MAG: IclR family transcriptional regulator [Anaerolineae bacterium]|nr:IclR family transcriptional regulator [Anaerolineae bacterium]
MAGRPNYQIRSVSRALRILSCFTPTTPELDLATLSARVDLPKSTVFRLLSVLESESYVERCGDGECYRVGISAFKAGSAYLAQLTLEKAARPHMEALVAGRNLSANLGVLSEHEVVYLVIVEPESALRFASTVGQRQHIHCSALGKVLVADLPEARVRDILAWGGMPARTPYTFTDPDAFLAHLDGVCAQGYAIDEQEAALGVRCVAAPVYDQHGEVICALSLSGPTSFYPPGAMSQVIDAVKATARAISKRLGYLPGEISLQSSQAYTEIRLLT